jgi:ABC-type antimicrobial peptide transport system permease subunit
VFTARYELISYMKHITSRLLKVKNTSPEYRDKSVSEIIRHSALKTLTRVGSTAIAAIRFRREWGPRVLHVVHFIAVNIRAAITVCKYVAGHRSHQLAGNTHKNVVYLCVSKFC